MKHDLINVLGQRFGRLVVLSYDKAAGMWLCACDCGVEKNFMSFNLRSGKTRSCGCLFRDTKVAVSTIHGGSYTRIYRQWDGMWQRCTNKRSRSYRDYGGRGISVYDAWRDFAVFREWAYANGYADDLTIDRRHVDGDYEPENVRWITALESQRNKRSTRWVETKDGVMSLAEAVERAGLSYCTVASRLKRGMSATDALSIPIGPPSIKIRSKKS